MLIKVIMATIADVLLLLRLRKVHTLRTETCISMKIVFSSIRTTCSTTKGKHWTKLIVPFVSLVMHSKELLPHTSCSARVPFTFKLL